MATKLNNITGQYHSYVEDQVLTHYQLNETIDYFDDQNRLQNLFLSGCGIACGFEVSVDVSYTAITLTQGTGITTDGDLIKLRTELANELSQTVKQKLYTIDLSSITYKSYKNFDTDKAKYAHFLNGSSMMTMWELLPEKAEDAALETGEKPLTDFVNLKDHVVLLYLENYTKEASLCSQTDCSNQGGEEVFNLRVLLVSKTTADSIIEKDSLYKKYDNFIKYNTLPELGVKKVIPTYSNTTSTKKVRQLFNAAFGDTDLRDDLNSGISTMLSSFNFIAEATTITNGITSLFGYDLNNPPTDIQYQYDSLKDIVATYKEIKDLYFQLGSECNPAIGSFPKHLFLGVVEDNNHYKVYRHKFHKAAVLDNHNKTFRNFDLLVKRLSVIIDNYDASLNNLKITPSKSSGKLGSKAVPFYYTVNPSFLYNWDFEKTNLFVQGTNFSYHTADLLNYDCIKTPLAYTIDDSDFYRIEGYLGVDVELVKTQLNTNKMLYGLDFDFQVIDIDENSTDLKNLLSSNPSFEHKAGVKKGGTLLLLKSGTDFIADFAVDYKIAADNGIGCCTIKECLYPWISSLKYINNLSRSMRGSTTETKVIPTHYILKVKKYSINSVNLITTPVTIQIPIQDVFVRRLHAVMEKLNTQFPTGLLFDFIEEEKKVKISKLDQDKFEFEVQDITFGPSSPIYKYTEIGLYKNTKLFTSVGISCSILNAHHADIYKKIHNSYDPINKDDDNFGRFDKDWSRWQTLKDKLKFHPETNSYQRYIKYFADFANIPTSSGSYVFDELVEIANAIKAINENLTDVYIGGDWVNGNWVNGSMYNYYKTNYKNTDDDLVLFMNLRKKLHNEDKVSKYMIHINTKKTVNLADFTNLFSLYATRADFYFDKPAIGNFIKIDVNYDKQVAKERNERKIQKRINKINKTKGTNNDNPKGPVA